MTAALDIASPDARLIAFAHLVRAARDYLAPPWSLVYLAARMAARSTQSLPYACRPLGQLIAGAVDPAAPAAAEMPLPDAVSRVGLEALLAGDENASTIERVWLFSVTTAQAMRAAPLEQHRALLAYYEAVRRIEIP